MLKTIGWTTAGVLFAGGLVFGCSSDNTTPEDRAAQQKCFDKGQRATAFDESQAGDNNFANREKWKRIYDKQRAVEKSCMEDYHLQKSMGSMGSDSLLSHLFALIVQASIERNRSV